MQRKLGFARSLRGPLAATGWGLANERHRLTLVAGTAGATLLVSDTWLNTLLISGGPGLASTILFGFAAEIPAAALCIYAVHVSRNSRTATKRQRLVES